MEIKATLNNLRVSPRKVRLVADLVRGKKLGEAKLQLQFLAKGVSPAMKKLLESAEANAKHNFKISDPDSLIIKKVLINEGRTLKRFMPRSHGSAYTIRKRTSHAIVVLSDK